MNIALLGYGKMGKEIEKIALDRGHNVPLIIDIDTQDKFNQENMKDIDVAIDFSIPDSAFENIKKCYDFGVNIVSGTTGWTHKKPEVEKLFENSSSSFFWASNFSLGVNVFFHLNKYLAKVMEKFNQYKVSMEETHHTQKLDAPSGTAITLAEGIIEKNGYIKDWELDKKSSESIIPIKAIRKEDVPGIHTIHYDSDVDYIEITHSAKSRKGFALGAVLAAEFIHGKKGIYTMDDLLDMN